MTDVVYQMRGYRSPSEVLAMENNKLLEFQQKLLYQPQPEAPVADQALAPVQQMRPQEKSVESWKNDVVGQQQLLRENLKSLMPNSSDIDHFITLVNSDRIAQINADWPIIQRKLAKRRVVTAGFLKGFTDDYFKNTKQNFGFYADEV